MAFIIGVFIQMISSHNFNYHQSPAPHRICFLTTGLIMTPLTSMVMSTRIGPHVLRHAAPSLVFVCDWQAARLHIKQNCNQQSHSPLQKLNLWEHRTSEKSSYTFEVFYGIWEYLNMQHRYCTKTTTLAPRWPWLKNLHRAHDMGRKGPSPSETHRHVHQPC